MCQWQTNINRIISLFILLSIKVQSIYVGLQHKVDVITEETAQVCNK